MRNKNIVIIANQPWDIEIGSNCKNIALEFAKQNNVLYVNAPLDRKNSIQKASEPWVQRRMDVIRKKKSGLEKIGQNIWMLQPDFIAASVNWIPVNFLHDFFNWRNNKKFARCIREGCQELGFDEFVIFNDSMMMKGFYLKKFLNPTLHIYYIRDYLISQPYFKRHGERLEKELIKNSDIVLANSLFLEEYARKFNPKSFDVGQGCEVDQFIADDSKPMPPELKSIPSPIIGYVGFLTTMRLDIKLLEYIAIHHPSWNIVLVGPEDDGFKNSNLHALQNVHFLGRKKPEELPSFVQYFDVCINPQIVNDLTIGNYPRKIDEYLTMGKPVVATKTKAMEYFKDYCYLATHHAEYADMIARALQPEADEIKKSRIAFALSHSWPNAVNKIYTVISDNCDTTFR